MNEISKDELLRGLLDVTALRGDLLGGSDVNFPEKNENISALNGLIAVYKKWGKTPLETLDELRQKYPLLEKVPLSYAGRLDPLAEGVMLVLVGDTNKEREKYLSLDKTYEVEILFGIQTDTCDLFGIPYENRDMQVKEKFESDEVFKVLQSFVGKQKFPYPVYSSKTVQGKPLFQWMNEGRIGEIEIPKTEIEIYSLELSRNGLEEASLNPVKKVRGGEILEKVELALDSVKGDFRYDEIRAGWVSALHEHEEESFPVIRIICECSSGTYMRVLAEEIGKKMGVPALAYSIKRTKVDSVGVSSVVG